MDKNNTYAILEKINAKFYELLHDYDYNNKDYTESLLSKNEKDIILKVYTSSRHMKENIDKILLNPKLAIYDDYKWIARLYKNNNSKEDIKEYIEKLISFFYTLKHYSIKNTIPKSNVLIIIYILSDYDLEETVKLLVENCRYEEYVDYIIENYKNCEKLYKVFNKKIENEKYINMEYISKIYYKFYLNFSCDEAYENYLYYSFLHNKNIQCLTLLKNSPRFDYYMDKLMNNTKDVIALEKIYLFLNQKKELFDLLLDRGNDYRLIDNIYNLRDDYNNEILTYLKTKFYETVEIEKSRQNYKRATIYIKGIIMLNDGGKLLDNFISELKKSKYSKRMALFDEIYNVIIKDRKSYCK